MMELGSEEAIMWTQFKEEFYREYSSSTGSTHVLSGVLMELKEEYTLRVMFQQETMLLVP